ncbi:MAG: aminopeptidase [Anaerolineales bacterium]|nr:aminopeptidase [Anaerolineales bacterium]
MIDPRIEKLADVLVNYSVAIQPGDKILIQGETSAAPLIEAVYKKCIQAGGHPFFNLILPNQEEIFYRYASDEQLLNTPDYMKYILETIDVRIKIKGAVNTKALSNIDAQKHVLAKRGQAELSKIFMQRSAANDLRWTVSLFPTHAFAQDADMSLSEYEDFVYGACLPDPDDPVRYWKRFSAWQQKIVEWFRGKEQVHIIGPGTDLKLSIAGRIFMNGDGGRNMPDGEIFTGPVEDSLEGHISFSYPAIYDGREVKGIQLWFEQGRVVKAKADKNENVLLSTLDTDEGSRCIGEFAIGTNKGINRFTGQILFDEKINGSIHLAVGQAYYETGALNQSAIHWDMISDLRDGGKIWVDDELLYLNGEFVIDFKS